MLRWLLLPAVVGCGGGEPPARVEPERAPERAPDPAPTSDPLAIPITQLEPPEGGGDAVSVEIHFHGVGPLHRGFFGSPDAIALLGEDLGVCLVGTGQVWVTYDSEARQGRIFLKASPDVLGACLPRVEGGAVDLAPLAPVGRALAGYRDRVAAAFDLRVSSFAVGATFVRGPSLCTVWAAGQNPPDGSTFSGCAEIGGREVCVGERRAGFTTLPLAGADLGTARECFRR